MSIAFVKANIKTENFLVYRLSNKYGMCYILFSYHAALYYSSDFLDIISLKLYEIFTGTGN